MPIRGYKILCALHEDGQQLEKQYKEYISSYRQWKQRSHAQYYVLFSENIGDRLSMDETCLSQGELYTIITNKSAKGRKGSLVTMICDPKSETVIELLNKIPRPKRLKVKAITGSLKAYCDEKLQ